MTNTRYLILPLLTTLLIWTLNNPIGKLPPLGKFLDPFHGYLALVDSDNINRLKMESSYLESPVTVIFDTLRIPHIFAENDIDLYFAQGYIWHLNDYGRWNSKPMLPVDGLAKL